MAGKLQRAARGRGVLGATCGAAVLSFAFAVPALAQTETRVEPGSEPGTTTTTTTSLGQERQYLGEELASAKPELGVLEFTDATGGATGRFAAGIGLDFNIVRAVEPAPSTMYYGISTGALFAHLGNASSGFVGSGTGVSEGLSGANSVLIPVDLKMGYDITDLMRVSVHGGGNVFYVSAPGSIALGGSFASSGANWDIFPNVGADFELSIGRNTAFLVRPDWTITPGAGVFLGTVGVSFLLG